MTLNSWFPRVPHEVPSGFLTRARELAPEVLGSLVSAQVSETHPGVWTEEDSHQGVCLTVLVPRTAARNWHLQARLYDGDLTAGWGDEMYFDDVGDALDVLTRSHFTEHDEPAAAEAAVRWMARQLSRPMRTETWIGRRALIGPRGVKAERIVFTDTDTVLAERGKRWIRRHGDPDRVIVDELPS
ncbi:hypothetical protein [Pengzhenrongella phosphoraccumulans]|uniref:hypothetical protein n=1 Tax=Pengzhenrongella phosphoraccumulans TaxID=3114394 RepID=UPI00388F0821